MKRRNLLAAVLVLITSFAHAETSIKYRPGGAKFQKMWTGFYKEAIFEPEIDEPLVRAGRAAVPAISEAIKNKDMKYRRATQLEPSAISEIPER
jgi:hypothetical protein